MLCIIFTDYRDLDRLRCLGVMDHTELAVAAPLTSKEDRIRELQQIYEEIGE